MGNKQSRKKVLPSPTPHGQKENQVVVRKGSNAELVKNEHCATSVENTVTSEYAIYQFPFECAVFEGGGAKGVAFCGVVRELEKAGIWKQVKRVAGTSAGAMTATMAAIGYNSYEMEYFLDVDMKKIVLDAQFKWLSFIPNFVRNFGWHPGKRLLHWFEDKLECSTGNRNITFLQLYKKTGVELCVVVCNVNQMDSEYCHPKTTPDMKIATAIRMSMSIPVLFEAVRYQGPINCDLYVDGGLLCNFALHAFDGWFLSMKKENSFWKKLQPLTDLPKLFDKDVRFGTFNEKTLGFLLYASNEQDLLKTELEERTEDAEPQTRPDTLLARRKTEEEKLRYKMEEEHDEVVNAADKFMRALTRSNLDEDDDIDRNELKEALEKNDSKFTARHRELLFGKNVSLDQVLDMMDVDDNGEISYQELVKFIEKRGVHLQSRFRGYERREIKGVMSYFTTLQDALLVNVKRIFIRKRDVERTIGINTDYIDTNDYDMDKKDKQFLIEQGTRATKAFLKYYVDTFKPPRKEDIDCQSSNAEEKSPARGSTVTPPNEPLHPVMLTAPRPPRLEPITSTPSDTSVNRDDQEVPKRLPPISNQRLPPITASPRTDSKV